jgi:cbb3-type cytochrome oxidase subunit 1
MPRLSVWFVRASLLYLLIGFLIGALILTQKGVPYASQVWALFPIHMEFLLIGWFAQLAMGVAFWIVPRFSSGPPRGDESIIWVSFVLINVGLLLGILQLWFMPSVLLGRTLEIFAGITFTIGLWRRIKPHGVLKPPH